MEKLTLNIKDGQGNVKTFEAGTFTISFGTIDKLMGLMDLDEQTSSFEVLKKITSAWKEIVKIMGEIFPDMTPEDWDCVKLNDLVPVVLKVVQFTFAEMMHIPSDPKN